MATSVKYTACGPLQRETVELRGGISRCLAVQCHYGEPDFAMSPTPETQIFPFGWVENKTEIYILVLLSL